MNDTLRKLILQKLGGDSLRKAEEVQTLWSGYGSITRYAVGNAKVSSIVVKQIDFQAASRHPRGWNSSIAHARKLKSYEVESLWYARWSKRCGDSCRVADCFAIEASENSLLIALEDLDQSGFNRRRSRPSEAEIKACLSWLAHFHAEFLGMTPRGLWETGTYWHLETRPEEWQALADENLKQAAPAIDSLLRQSPYQTIVHGDAKVANFCFSPDGRRVAALDFQYVGGGCGVKDVAYFLGSCLSEGECEAKVRPFLQFYLETLATILKQQKPEVDRDQLVENWQNLFPVAWADFHRFLKGWSPEHWKINSYSERVTKEVVEMIRR